MEKEKIVNFMIDEKLYQKLKQLAVRENRSIKEIMQEQVASYCKIHEEGNPQHLISKFLENEDFVGFPAIAIEFQNKKAYIQKNCQTDGRLNDFGKELHGNICQWYEELQRL